MGPMSISEVVIDLWFVTQEVEQLYPPALHGLPNKQDLVCYELHSFPRFTIDACTAPTGAYCGALYLDRGFEELVRNKVGTRYLEIWSEGIRRRIREYFSDNIKEDFNPTSDDCQEEFNVPFDDVPDLPQIGIQAGFLTLRK